MFVKIEENSYVNLERIEGIELKSTYTKYYWAFWGSDGEPFETKEFETKEDALKWFKDNIEPALKDYNKSRESLFEIATFLDTLPERINKALKGEKI